MKKNSYIAYLIDKGVHNDQIEYAINEVEKLEQFLNERKTNLSTCSSDDIQDYMDSLIGKGENSLKGIIFLSRYFLTQNNTAIYIYFTQLIGVSGVIENIMKRLKIAEEKMDLGSGLMKKVKILPIGSSPKKYPDFIKGFMNELKSVFDIDEVRWILAGNNHQIPSKSFDDEKKRFIQADSIDDYLKERHERAVRQLTKHAEEGTVWFEQIITPEVVEYIRSNQEILGGIRRDNKILLTKIPYNPSEFLKSEKLSQKRYMACHCPFIRQQLLHDFSDIDSDWCYCSGGFAKTPFEHIFEEELEVELLESCLTGSDKCRFSITIPKDYWNE